MGCSTAIILAAGTGSRMKSTIQKQYMKLCGFPLIYYALDAFEKSYVEEIVLVTGAEDIPYCRREIVEKYQFRKVKKLIPGGSERYLSVYEGLKAAEGSDYVLIHDGARPFVDPDIIERTLEAAKQYGSGIAAMPVKDTIKEADTQCFVTKTLRRDALWQIQTPQTFSYNLIKEAYDRVLKQNQKQQQVTDDAMVLELAFEKKAKLVEGSYRNIKVTTPEDLLIAEAFLDKTGREQRT